MAGGDKVGLPARVANRNLADAAGDDPGTMKSPVLGSVLKTCPVGPEGVPLGGTVTVSRVVIGLAFALLGVGRLYLARAR